MYARKTIEFIVILVFLLLLPPNHNKTVRAQATDPVGEMMNRMSVEDKVGQLFIVPFVGAEANPGSDVWQLITEYKVGGVILLAANSNFNNDPSAPRQITELNNTLKTTAFHTNGIPLFISIDHEGDGYPYTRITRGVSPIPGQMAVGATWDTANAEAVGEIVGQELSAMGVNLLFGPGLDVLNDPRPTGRGDISTRVFGGDPYWVAQMGRAYVRGVHQGSNGAVATVAKHFPGHGGSDRLPDNEIATVDKSLQELRRIELPPFFEATAKIKDDPLGVTDALMSSHIRYRGFQGDIRQLTAPISFDAGGMTTLTTLPEIAPWRQNGGLIISDALGVPAVRKHYDPSLQTFPHRRIAKDAFLAGNDILSLVQFDLKSIWPDQFANIKDTIFFFRTEYINNPAFAAKVDEAVARILRLKLKLYPEITLDALNTDPVQALQTTAQPRSIISDIARQSSTLLYPSPEELRLRLPEAPRPDEKIVIINDTRFTRECFTESCKPKELFIPRTLLQETILRLYGPQATGEIRPENINTITFSELKQALAGAILPLSDPAAETESEENRAIQLGIEEVGAHIQAADWLIFSALDLNINRYPNSDALKLFLSQESGTLRDKNTVVFAFNAPYYLDTTEVTKLTAYFGLYSKTLPHIEEAVRALFGEAQLSGAAPVSVEGIGYTLPDALAPDPNRDFALELLETIPKNGLAPFLASVQAGPIFDRNGHQVPDGTPVNFIISVNNQEAGREIAYTTNGVAEAQLSLAEPGENKISALAGLAQAKQPVQVSVEALATPTSPPPTPEPSPTKLPSPTATATLENTATPSPTPTETPQIPAETTPQPAPPLPSPPKFTAQSLDGVDLLLALGATLLAGLLGFWVGNQHRQPLARRVRLGLWAFIAGVLAYLLYGVGFLRPELFLLDAPGPAAKRLTIALLSFVFALAALTISIGANKRISE